VIEHARLGEQDRLVEDIRHLLRPTGQALVTTDRGEIYERWRKAAEPTSPRRTG
jgi:hypothetical protein